MKNNIEIEGNHLHIVTLNDNSIAVPDKDAVIDYVIDNKAEALSGKLTVERVPLGDANTQTIDNEEILLEIIERGQASPAADGGASTEQQPADTYGSVVGRIIDEYPPNSKPNDIEHRAELVKRARELGDVSKAELGKRLGVSGSTIDNWLEPSRWEINVNGTPIDVLRATRNQIGHDDNGEQAIALIKEHGLTHDDAISALYQSHTVGELEDAIEG